MSIKQLFFLPLFFINLLIARPPHHRDRGQKIAYTMGFPKTKTVSEQQKLEAKQKFASQVKPTSKRHQLFEPQAPKRLLSGLLLHLLNH